MAETNAAAAKRAAPSSASAGSVKAKKVKLESYIHVLNADSATQATFPYYIGVAHLQKMATPVGRHDITTLLGDQMSESSRLALDEFTAHVDTHSNIATTATTAAMDTLREYCATHRTTWNGLLGLASQITDAKKIDDIAKPSDKVMRGRYAKIINEAATLLSQYIKALEGGDEMVPAEGVVAKLKSVVDVLAV